WFVFFSVAAFVYRIFITFAIAIFVASQYFFIGVLLAIWAVASAFVLPLIALIGYVGWSPRLRRQRPRVIATTAGVAISLFILIFVVPVPAWTNAQGVIWVPEQSAVRVGADGFVTRLIARPGDRVRRGEPLIDTTDPALPPKIRALEARESELLARYQSEIVAQRVRAQITLEQLKAVEADLALSRERAQDLVVRSPGDGVFAVDAPQDLPGRFLKQGTQIGYVIPDAAVTARVVVPQQAVDLVRSRTEGVQVKLAERAAETLTATILREVPHASDRLPSMALSQMGGGDVALDPTQGRDGKSLETLFEFEIALPTAQPTGYGGRVYVRFDHGRESVASQIWRSLRQTFMRHLTI
ncbi:MAG: HlyD family secretion protein, partial [Betaproteobacteria bacterium]|nr:HlyD family secretion protein [Betaproteobacteria bacterium]